MRTLGNRRGKNEARRTDGPLLLPKSPQPRFLLGRLSVRVTRKRRGSQGSLPVELAEFLTWRDAQVNPQIAERQRKGSEKGVEMK